MRVKDPIKTGHVNIKSSYFYYVKSGRKGIARNPYISIASYFWSEIGEDLINGKSYKIPDLGKLVSGRFENHWNTHIPDFINWYTEMEYVPEVRRCRDRRWKCDFNDVYCFTLSQGLKQKLYRRMKENPNYIDRFQIIKRKGQL